MTQETLSLIPMDYLDTKSKAFKATWKNSTIASQRGCCDFIQSNNIEQITMIIPLNNKELDGNKIKYLKELFNTILGEDSVIDNIGDLSYSYKEIETRHKEILALSGFIKKINDKSKNKSIFIDGKLANMTENIVFIKDHTYDLNKNLTIVENVKLRNKLNSELTKERLCVPLIDEITIENIAEIKLKARSGYRIQFMYQFFRYLTMDAHGSNGILDSLLKAGPPVYETLIKLLKYKKYWAIHEYWRIGNCNIFNNNDDKGDNYPAYFPKNSVALRNRFDYIESGKRGMAALISEDKSNEFILIN